MVGAPKESPRVSTVRLGAARPAPALSQKRVRFHKVRSADGTVVEAWSNVAQGPAVLVCNGLGLSPYAWPALLEEDCGLRVVSWNHRGVGRSQRPRDLDRVGVVAFVEDAVAVLDDAGVDRCVVAGWSLGVGTAFELARRHPDRVSGLFAVAGAPGRSYTSVGAPLVIPRPWRAPAALALARTLEFVGPLVTPLARRVPMGPVSTTMLRCGGLLLPTARPEDVRRSAREFLTTPMEWHGHLAVAAAGHRPAPPDDLDVPVCFVTGRLDVLASRHDIRSAARLLPDVRRVTVWGGHFLTLERPRAVTALLREFAEQVAGPQPA